MIYRLAIPHSPQYVRWKRDTASTFSTSVLLQPEDFRVRDASLTVTIDTGNQVLRCTALQDFRRCRLRSGVLTPDHSDLRPMVPPERTTTMHALVVSNDEPPGLGSDAAV